MENGKQHWKWLYRLQIVIYEIVKVSHLIIGLGIMMTAIAYLTKHIGLEGVVVFNPEITRIDLNLE